MSGAPTPGDPWDVAIVGGGPAGLAAGLFTARHGLRTIVFDRGKSLLRQCAYLENYLGLPGVDVTEFLRASRTQVQRAGCLIEDHHVIAVRAGGVRRFEVSTSRGPTIAADRLVAASGTDAPYLAPLAEPSLLDGANELRDDVLLSSGRTIVEGLYVAGPLTGLENQALVSAGHGAQVALSVIADVRAGAGLWAALAHHVDWRVRKGTYDGDRWARRVHEHFAPTAPSEPPLEEAARDALIQDWIRLRRAQQLDAAEIARRREDAGALRRADGGERP